MSQIPAAYSVASLADRWGLTRRQVNAMITRGDLRAFRIGKIFRVMLAEVERVDAVLAERPPDHRQRTIYFIRATESGKIKIGFSLEPRKRFSGILTACPEPVELLGTIAGTVKDERALHTKFGYCRHIGEWFRPHPELLAFIAEVTA